MYPLSEVLIPRQASAFGRVQPLYRIELSAEVSGPVVWRSDLDNGDLVQTGQPLIRIDPATFDARLAAAKASVQSAEAAIGDLDEESKGLLDRRPGLSSQLQALTREADRLRRAVDSGAVGSSAFDQAEAARLQAEDALTRLDLAARRIETRRAVLEAQKASALAAQAEAQDQRNRCEITSALDGQLDAFDVQLGERVALGQIIASVTGQADVELELTIPASMFGVVTAGDRVTLRRTGSAASRTVSIDRIAPAADPSGRTFQAWVEL
ncbi:MAG: HlyD family efflux transporter periplasmic adaptor subunit, partial [Planctomycetota bacterium]